ncbi:MAG: hypothetical protein VX405_10305 [Myxococcota bacterium]|nr:hypothetical protein [Myxococcota bacterium]
MTISDPEIRLTVAGQALRELPAEDCLDWLETQGLSSATPPQAARPAIIAIVRNLCRQPLSRAWWQSLGEAADARSRRDLVALCTEVEESDQTRLRQTLDRELQEKTVGYRISHARTANPSQLDRLIHDQEPRVIRSLLGNSKLTLQQVLRLVTRRPLIRPVVDELIDAPKWSQIYEVHRGLARNDTVSHRVRLAHLLLLAPNDLHRLARDPMQSELARRAARYRFIEGIESREYPTPRLLEERVFD